MSTLNIIPHCHCRVLKIGLFSQIRSIEPISYAHVSNLVPFPNSGVGGLISAWHIDLSKFSNFAWKYGWIVARFHIKFLGSYASEQWCIPKRNPEGPDDRETHINCLTENRKRTATTPTQLCKTLKWHNTRFINWWLFFVIDFLFFWWGEKLAITIQESVLKKSHLVILVGKAYKKVN